LSESDDTHSNDTQRDGPSKYDVQVAAMKRRLRPGQFSLKQLFLITVALAVVLSIPRAVGSTHSEFFLPFYALLFVFAPYVILIVTSRFSWLRLRYRILLAVVSTALLILPALIGLKWVANWDNDWILATVIGMSMFWLPQIMCIWCVRFFLFRQGYRYRSTRLPPNQP